MKLEYNASEIKSIKRLRECSQFVHLKAKLLSPCDSGRVNYSTSSYILWLKKWLILTKFYISKPPVVLHSGVSKKSKLLTEKRCYSF